MAKIVQILRHLARPHAKININITIKASIFFRFRLKIGAKPHLNTGRQKYFKRQLSYYISKAKYRRLHTPGRDGYISKKTWAISHNFTS